MAKPILLSDALDEYASSRRSQGLSKSTIKGDLQVIRQMMALTGNLHTRSLTARHLDAWFEWSMAEHEDATRDLYLSKLRHFFTWCQTRGYADLNIAGDRRVKIRHTEDTRVFVPMEDFPRLLDATRHPRDRMLVACGLYLFLRVGETAALRLPAIDLEAGTIGVRMFKTNDSDVMPICAELDDELRRWLTVYEQRNGPLKDDLGKWNPDYYLIPRKLNYNHDRSPSPSGRFVPNDDSSKLAVLPGKQCGRPSEPIQRALEACDYPIKREGGHTLRRSGALALYEILRQDSSENGALREVQSLLHHKHQEMTEHYLGVKPERERRNAKLKGQPLFPRKARGGENVVQLRRNGDGSQTDARL